MDCTALQSVDFVLASNDPIEGLVPVDDDHDGLSPHERAVVRQASAFPDVTYVYFRRFSDGRSSRPAAYVVDNSDESLSNQQLAKLHNDLWLHGVAPLIYVTWPSRIDILSCARGADFWQADSRIYNPAEQFEIASEVETELSKRRRFSAYRLADGTFWDDPQNHSLANHEKAAHESLIQAIVETDDALDGDSNPVLRRLLLLMVLIKYLEDRQVFPGPGWFGRFHKGSRSFFDVLKSGEPDRVQRLLKTLEERFNGDVFALPRETKLTRQSLRRFAQLVESKTLNQQRYLWEQFSFAHLPVEVISHLYQRFVKGSTAVYTPPFLADLLLDYAMPYERLTGSERVLDPACGSGVFLVGAFRRLLNAWRSKHTSVEPDVETLKSILGNQIFGVELDSNAIDLTAFSLALAVCDSLQPNVIWNKLRFDPLRGKSLLQGDFFGLVDEFDNAERTVLGLFDVIIGNPPFESTFSEPARQINEARIKTRGEIPDNQIAYLFLDVGLQFLESNGQLCLIQPSGFLYNLKAYSFRSAIAKTERLKLVLDFSSVRGLYEGVDPKTIAVVLGEKHTSPILHLTFRRTYEAKERLGFELDHYDRHQVRADDINSNPYIWRVGLLGGGRLRHISERFHRMQTLQQFVLLHNWEYGEGFIAATSGRRTPAPFLTGMELLPTSALNCKGIDSKKLSTVTDTEFRSAYSPRRYAAPLLLIKKHEGLFNDVWTEGSLAYRAQIVGIHPNSSDDELFDKFINFFQSRHQTLQFAVTLNGSGGLGVKATAIEKQDIDALPCPDNENELDLVWWETILQEDTLGLFLDFVRRGQNSDLLQTAVSKQDMHEYSLTFCRMLDSIYDNLKPSEPVFLDGLICQPFYFGEEPVSDWLAPNCQRHLANLVFDNSMASLRTIRVVRFYHENVLFIVKPNRLRYWIRSTAIRDADDTIVDLLEQGY